MKRKLFNVSRRAAEQLKRQRKDQPDGGDRKHHSQSVDDVSNLHAELDSLKYETSRLNGPLPKREPRFSLEEARRIIRENSVGESGIRNRLMQSLVDRSRSANEERGNSQSNNSEQLYFTGTLQQHHAERRSANNRSFNRRDLSPISQNNHVASFMNPVSSLRAEDLGFSCTEAQLLPAPVTEVATEDAVSTGQVSLVEDRSPNQRLYNQLSSSAVSSRMASDLKNSMVRSQSNVNPAIQLVPQISKQASLEKILEHREVFKTNETSEAKVAPDDRYNEKVQRLMAEMVDLK